MEILNKIRNEKDIFTKQKQDKSENKGGMRMSESARCVICDDCWIDVVLGSFQVAFIAHVINFLNGSWTC